jgi:ubiquinone/menaquinone biosynthesis C-methylase UbiE
MTLNRVEAILDGLVRDSDGIYSSGVVGADDQRDEIRLRDAFARASAVDALHEVSRHHSIRVMDNEVRWFVDRLPRTCVVVDVGGGWGWHWRNLAAARSDVCVCIVDFARENLRRAGRMLRALVGNRIFLVHGDATKLPFPSDAFDGYWSVQTLQHIPRFETAVREAHRVLRRAGEFASYSLNRPLAIEAAYRASGRPFHVVGRRSNGIYLSRASGAQGRIIGRVFQAVVKSRYTEILFHPDLRVYTGDADSRVGAMDARLSSRMPLLALVARQRSFHTRKAACVSLTG